uniref:Uncharacterized protein n=1 Tax=Lepeophtheirus salmonis TaxID=72036 RepID=A0A0K2TMP4_LEPSM
MSGIISIYKGVEGIFFWPKKYLDILYTMLRKTWSVSNCAKWKIELRRVEIQGTFNTCSESWKYDTSVSLKALRSPVNDGNDRALNDRSIIVILKERDDHSVDPSPSYNAVQTTENDVELSIKGFIKLLDCLVMRNDLSSFDPFVDEFCSGLRLEFPYVRRTKQKLTIQVGNVNRVHVNHINGLEAHEGYIFKKLTSQSTGSNHEKSAGTLEEFQDLR